MLLIVIGNLVSYDNRMRYIATFHTTTRRLTLEDVYYFFTCFTSCNISV